jgi:hypothetical protein
MVDSRFVAIVSSKGFERQTDSVQLTNVATGFRQRKSKALSFERENEPQ